WKSRSHRVIAAFSSATIQGSDWERLQVRNA
ncbi:hypothetical protein AVDCRST_MAG94-6110, partial [uncultured Leptolyngbya sp.]